MGHFRVFSIKFRLVAFDWQDGPVEILPFLFLGSAHHSSRRETLTERGITAVLNVSSSCPNLFEAELRYMTLRVEDSLAADIRARFPEAICFIGELQPVAWCPGMRLCPLEAEGNPCGSSFVAWGAPLSSPIQILHPELDEHNIITDLLQ